MGELQTWESKPWPRQRQRGASLDPSAISDFTCFFIQDLGSLVLFNTRFKQLIYRPPNTLNIKEFCKPLEIKHGGNIYTIEIDNHYKSGLPSHLVLNPCPEENLILLRSA